MFELGFNVSFGGMLTTGFAAIWIAGLFGSWARHAERSLGGNSGV